MIGWMMRALLAGAVVALATWLGGLALGWLGRPRRWVWAGGLAAAALLPFLGLLLPARATPAAAAVSPADLATLLAANADASAAAAHPSLPGWLPGALWAAASLLLLLEQAYAYVRLARLRRGWVRARVDGTEVLIAEHVGPAVVGVSKPTVVVPPWLVAAPERERRMALAHEREHVRAGDTRLLAAGSLVTAVLPWSPALWWLQRRLRDAVETDCDARVLAAGCDVHAYGRMLVAAAARPGRRLARVALAERRNLLERRIRAMKSQLPSRPVARAAALAVGIIALVAAACELSAPPSPRTEQPAPASAAATPAATPQQTPATVTDWDHLVATDTGEIRNIIVDKTSPGGPARIRVIHKDGRVEEAFRQTARLPPDSATAYAAGYAAGLAAAARDQGTGKALSPEAVAKYKQQYLQALATAGATGGVAKVGYGTHARVPDAVPARDNPGAAFHVQSVANGAYVLLVDGRESPHDVMKQIDPQKIESVDVRKVRDESAPDTIKVTMKK